MSKQEGRTKKSLPTVAITTPGKCAFTVTDTESSRSSSCSARPLFIRVNAEPNGQAMSVKNLSSYITHYSLSF